MDSFQRAATRFGLRPVGLLLASLLAVFVPAPALAETPIPPAPEQWVTDTAGFLSPDAAALLNSRLKGYEQQTQHHLLVWIGSTMDGGSIEDWAVRAFEAWKVGKKGVDDGVVLFIFAKDRKLRFEVGYGLEGVVPDAIASRVINEIMLPRIRAGDNEGAVVAGMEAIAAAIGGPPLPGGGRTGRRSPGRQPLTLGQLILGGIAAIIFLIIFIKNPWLALFLLSSQSGGRRDWDGGGGGGGGWSGGGGRSGGGGASGSW